MNCIWDWWFMWIPLSAKTHKNTHKAQNIFRFKGLPGFSPFNIRGGCIQGHFLIVNPPMRCKIQCSSVSLWSDNGKCQNFQYMCLEMSPKVVWAWQTWKPNEIKHALCRHDYIYKTMPCVCCITYINCYTKSIKSLITAWKKDLCRCWTAHWPNRFHSPARLCSLELCPADGALRKQQKIGKVHAPQANQTQ